MLRICSCSLHVPFGLHKWEMVSRPSGDKENYCVFERVEVFQQFDREYKEYLYGAG